MANHTNSGYRNTRTHTLVECAMLLAISTALAFFPTFEIMPNGGSITICSMLPIILISYRHGLRWGFLSSFAYALIQLIEEFMSNGADVFSLFVALVFDYLLAFTVLGIGGLFRGKFKSARAELVCGTVTALALRFISHCVSGYVVWGEYAEWFFSEAGAWGQSILATYAGNGLMLIYSLIYNASYMLPELIITVIGAALLSSSSVVTSCRAEAAE
ncbi:MAG: energy-coupled thiamine transporter ThiT [Oscillospiraceae bacterium]|nr:energy-coupled thiamine transporter ThiT [Oscillospiraceae bacterium]